MNDLHQMYSCNGDLTAKVFNSWVSHIYRWIDAQITFRKWGETNVLVIFCYKAYELQLLQDAAANKDKLMDLTENGYYLMQCGSKLTLKQSPRYSQQPDIIFHDEIYNSCAKFHQIQHKKIHSKITETNLVQASAAIAKKVKSEFESVLQDTEEICVFNGIEYWIRSLDWKDAEIERKGIKCDRVGDRSFALIAKYRMRRSNREAPKCCPNWKVRKYGVSIQVDFYEIIAVNGYGQDVITKLMEIRELATVFPESIGIIEKSMQNSNGTEFGPGVQTMNVPY